MISIFPLEGNGFGMSFKTGDDENLVGFLTKKFDDIPVDEFGINEY